MIQYKQFLTEKIPVILSNLAKNYAETNTYLDLDGLKKRARYDLFIITRILQRFILTMTLNRVNTPSLTVNSRISWMIHEFTEAYQKVTEAKDEEEISKILNDLNDSFVEIEEQFVELIQQHNNSQYNYYGYNDITNIKQQFGNFRIPGGLLQGMARTSHHTNVFIPYAESLDSEYINTYDMLAYLQHDFNNLRYHGFSKSDNTFRRLYYKYLTSEWTHCDIRYNTFDAVFMTFYSAFGSNQNYYKRIYNYARPGGTVILYGLRSDFLPAHLERMAMTLDNIHVKFFSHSIFVADAGGSNDFCIIFGRKVAESPNWMSSYNRLMDSFLTGESTNDSFVITGSEEEVTPFRSYNLTEEEYEQMLPILPQSDKGIMQMLFPKKIKDTRRPLLPFTSGQLGLVLISGDINGTIEEKDTRCRHAVKGSSSRTSTTNTEPVLNQEGIETGYKTVTISYPITTVQIITASGDIKEIGGRMSS